MKKIALFMSALALAFSFTACGEKENNNGGLDLDNVVEDGFFVAGPATGTNQIAPEYMMTAGVNEVEMDKNGKTWDEAKREGMFEKYIVLEADKDFELLLNEAGTQTRYSAELKPHKAGEGSDGTIDAFRGELKIGADAPAMKVEKTGLYHIVLDLNTNTDLLYPQILVVPVTWGVRGDCNGWGFTEFETPATVSNEGITYTMTDVEFKKAGNSFKFAHDGIWKLQLDDAGNVKAHTNLGDNSQNGGPNITVDKAGYYTLTLTFSLQKGAIANSYKYTVECTEEIEVTAPTEMYIIGDEFGGNADGWDWNSDSVVSMTPVNGTDGIFWAVRYMHAGKGFKFCSVREWNGDFCTLGENTGFITPKDNQVEADGLYLIYVDANGAGKIAISPAVVCGLGDAFGGWDATNAGQVPATVNTDGTVSLTATADGLLRTFAKIDGVDAWKSEFSAFDGKIVYRGHANDFSAENAVALTTGQTVTYNFNAGTAVVE